jgi:tRNA A-37 threonylcarbamoyl transferase component Bud32
MKPLATSDPTTVASYRLLGVLGAGGMGRVYLGQSRSGRRVAIKVIRSELAEDRSFRLRFTREVAAARTVSPLYTAAVVDADTEADLPWLATTYVDGPSLEELVLERGPMAPGPVLTLAAGLAEALASIHGSGLVHRDLKPSNVLLDDSGPHIIDFGIALAPDITRMTTSVVVGTPSFMAPERIHGSEAGPAGDIFSLGATLVFAATGRNLVNDGTMYAQVLQMTLGRYDLSALPTQLRPLVVRCVSKRPEDRPTAEELTRILAASGVAPPGPGWQIAASPAPVVRVNAPRRVQVRRRTLLAFGGVLGAAAVSGGFAWAAGMFDRPPRFGEVLWKVQTNARRPDGAGAFGDRLMVHRGQRVITIDGPDVMALDTSGDVVWQRRQLSPKLVGLFPWGNDVLVAGDETVWRLDPNSGAVQAEIPVVERERQFAATGASPQIGGLAVAGDRVYLNLGTAIVGIDDEGNQVWRSPRSADADAPALSDPTWADNEFVVAQSVVNGTARTTLYDAKTGRSAWTQQYELTPEPPDQGPGGPSPGPGGSDGDRRPPGEPRHVVDARHTNNLVIVRDHHEVRCLRPSDGHVKTRIIFSTRDTAIEVVGDTLLIAASQVELYRLPDTVASGTFELGGVQLARVDTGRAVAVGHGVLALIDTVDGSGRDAQVPDVRPERITVEAGVAYITFQPPPPDHRDQNTPDVMAVSLGDEVGPKV